MTTIQPLLFYNAMTVTRSLRKLAQACLLALAAWVLTVGVASAHGGHGSQVPVQTVSPLPPSYHDDGATTFDLPEEIAASAEHGGSSCPSGTPATHSASCCTIACHAAMAVPPIDAWAGPRAASPLLVGLSDLLEGRCGDRSERPPRLA
ncbi:MAG: hypothetical protein EPO67_11370 [Reyranella sp.]|nr:MAG: hypothetical protein EPO67_11370 [Reyranella sp.]